MPLPLIIAYKYLFAQEAARTVLNLSRFKFVSDRVHLYGIPRQTEVFLVRDRRYAPSSKEYLNRALILEVADARDLTIKRIELP